MSRMKFPVQLLHKRNHVFVRVFFQLFKINIDTRVMILLYNFEYIIDKPFFFSRIMQYAV